jgi:hypothetical protein
MENGSDDCKCVYLLYRDCYSDRDVIYRALPFRPFLMRENNRIASTIWVICCATVMLWLLLEILK